MLDQSISGGLLTKNGSKFGVFPNENSAVRLLSQSVSPQ